MDTFYYFFMTYLFFLSQVLLFLEITVAICVFYASAILDRVSTKK